MVARRRTLIPIVKSVEILEWKERKWIWKRKISYFEGNHLLSKGRI